MTSNKVLYSGLASFTELARFHPIGVLHLIDNDYTNTSFLAVSR